MEIDQSLSSSGESLFLDDLKTTDMLPYLEISKQLKVLKYQYFKILIVLISNIVLHVGISKHCLHNAFE